MLKHRCAALLISTMLKHRCAALLIFTMLKLHSSVLFISSHLQKHSSPPVPHHSYSRNNSVQHLFRFSPSIAETPLAATFPVAETPATFHFLPVAETLITSNPSSLSRC
jgi:hypothetical protein